MYCTLSFFLNWEFLSPHMIPFVFFFFPSSRISQTFGHSPLLFLLTHIPSPTYSLPVHPPPRIKFGIPPFPPLGEVFSIFPSFPSGHFSLPRVNTSFLVTLFFPPKKTFSFLDFPLRGSLLSVPLSFHKQLTFLDCPPPLFSSLKTLYQCFRGLFGISSPLATGFSLFPRDFFLFLLEGSLPSMVIRSPFCVKRHHLNQYRCPSSPKGWFSPIGVKILSSL